MDVSKSSAGEAVGLQPCGFMVRSIALDIRYTPMYQTIIVKAETKVLRSATGRGAGYPVPLELGFMIGCH